jgi:hypothetical protein
MSNLAVFRLSEEVCFEPPRAWLVQARFAFVYAQGKPFAAKAGRLAIYLGPRNGFDGQEERVEHLYRFSDGRVGMLNAPPDGRFTPVDDADIVALASQIKTLPELISENGLRLESLSCLDPFTLIVCPLCRGTDLITVDLATVWCDTCNTRFTTRMTAGDPGVVVDADPAYYRPARARYVIPRRDLTLTVVLKDFGYSSHPEDRCGDHCVNGTTYEERAARGYYVSAPTSLRDSDRWCGLEIYDWSLYGKAKRPDRGNRELRDVIDAPDAADRIYGKQVRSRRLPSVDLLADGEPDGEGREWWYLADVLCGRDGGIPRWPVWWKVRAELEPTLHGQGRVVKGWVVTDRTLCPGCLRPVLTSRTRCPVLRPMTQWPVLECGTQHSAAEGPDPVQDQGEHAHCNWDRIGWQPEEGDLPGQKSPPEQ